MSRPESLLSDLSWLSGRVGSGVAEAALAVLAVGFFVIWHPLRRHLSDAFDFLLTRRLPLWVTLLALGLEEWLGGKGRLTIEMSALMNAGSSAERAATALPVLKVLAMDAAVLLHQAIPSVPLAVLLPVWMVMATVGLHRYPYRYQREKLRTDQRTVLVVISALAVVWSGVWVFSRGAAPRAELEVVMQPLTLIFSSLATAAYQVWLARSVVQWAEPRAGEMSARDETIARWQNVLWLGAFNAAWTAVRLWMGGDAAWLPWSVLVEVLVVFAPLPVAVASERGSLAQAGGRALRMLWGGWWRLLVWIVTAVVLLALAEWSVEMSATINGPVARVVRVLVTGLVQAWLVPAALLMLYRRGFPSKDASSL